MKCPKCNSNRLQEACLASNPPQYEYYCNGCGWGLRHFQRRNSNLKLTDEERQAAKPVQVIRFIVTED